MNPSDLLNPVNNYCAINLKSFTISKDFANLIKNASAVNLHNQLNVN